MVVTRVELPMDVIADFCRRRGIARLELFGSALRDDFGPSSDLDFLYTLDVHGSWSLLNHAAAQNELSDLLGRRVDLVSRSAVERSDNPWRRKRMLGTARVIFDA
jgi:predicted nucleotidyltransferase